MSPNYASNLFSAIRQLCPNYIPNMPRVFASGFFLTMSDYISNIPQLRANFVFDRLPKLSIMRVYFIITGIPVRTVEQSSQQDVPELPTSVVEHPHLPKGDEKMVPAVHVRVRMSRLQSMICLKSSTSPSHPQHQPSPRSWRGRWTVSLIF